jgi:tRNA nucleotidyltransferase (CCA-adding enzyme)
MYWFAISTSFLDNCNPIRHLAVVETAEAGNLMPDYIYLLENRLSADQRSALTHLRQVARDAGTILFLTGDAVRDLTSGHAVRDLEVAVHGNALKLKKAIEKVGGKVWGEHEPSQSLYLCFPGTVRVDLVTAHSVTYPKPGKPVYHPASIQEDLLRRDFTVNAMAISLNEGSFGLLMDPLNGAADIEARTLRLVSNYGFIEDPSLLIRATRYHARLGWELDLKTRTRYDNAKEEGTIEFLNPHGLAKEVEQIGHESDGLAVLRALEAEGWMKFLFPAWTSNRADEEKLKVLHDLAVSLLMQGVHADMSAAQMQLLTAKMPPKDIAALKKAFLRPGFVEEWNSLDSLASTFQKVLLSKEHTIPSSAYKLFTTYDPEAVLWLGFTSKNAAVQEKYNNFLKVWPEARQKIPFALMQEMRITPELPTYSEVSHKVFLELIDGKLTTPEEMRAFLEPFSPPAPPPQVTIKRTRVKRSEKVKEPVFDDDEEAEEALTDDEDLDDIGGDEDELDLGLGIPKGDVEEDSADEDESADDDLDDDEEEKPAASKGRGGRKVDHEPPAKMGAKPTAVPAKPAPASPAKPASNSSAKPVHAEKPAAKPAAKPVAKPASKPVPPSKPAQPAKKEAKPAAKPQLVLKEPATKASTKPPMKAHLKVKTAPKPIAKTKPHPKPAKPVVKKPVGKPAKKR